MSNQLQVGQVVFVDFKASNRTDADGTHFHGHGVLDRVEDDVCYGRLDNNLPFCCPVDCVFTPREDYKAPSDIDLFIAYIKQDPGYKDLVISHGNNLFNRDKDYGFRVLAMRVAYRLWQQQRAKQSITGRELNRFNIILCLFLAVIVVNYCNDFGVPAAAPFVANTLVLSLAIWVLINSFKFLMSKRTNE